MPSVKAKFIEKKDGETIRCPKNEKGLRRLPECGTFNNTLRPFQPINPPPIPPPPPHHNPFSPFRMTGLPDVFKRDIIPNTPASRDVRFPDPELLPDNVDGQDDYYNFRRLKNDEEIRSEEHTSELQSRLHLVCRLLLEKKKTEKKKKKDKKKKKKERRYERHERM